ncbi:hypothetical protein [Burkholderia vietnamiensis]|uniref:hypothetical protein n=1 Tax=Burkholderia vietnamiensis TaxID=60552 RepID=UPI001CB35D2D|nr:hypothetical protein [Burkholderia vietnamiensis]CAG9228670.1 hypothetical protein BVI1335_70076 [Burkholderia vietnamiensis]HDR9086387.1 hypothetical protein [Burkholderia vietnamiensis]
MLENLEWFGAVMLVIAAGCAIGAVVYLLIDVLTGGPVRFAREKRCAMPKRVRSINGVV